MQAPVKPAAPPPSGDDAQAPGTLADAVAAAALKQAPPPTADPAQKWEEMGGELYERLEAKDKAGFGVLFAKQVRLAVKEALRGNK